VGRLICFVSNDFTPPAATQDFEFIRLEPENVAGPDQFGHDDVVLIAAGIGTTPIAQQLGGALRLAMERGTVVVFAYREQVGEIEGRFLRTLLGEMHGDSHGSVRPVENRNEIFDEYLSVFGHSTMGFTFQVEEGLERLGTVQRDTEVLPAAFLMRRGRGGAYVVPYSLGGAYEDMFRRLCSSVLLHWEGGDEPPAYLSELRVAGEQILLDEISERTATLEELRAKARYFSEFRHLAGSLTGGSFEAHVIHALNTVFEGTSHRAEDREDLHMEDFWILDGDQEVVLCEAKGIGSNIRRPDVNQVDNARSERQLDVNFPGLLVVNTFRGAAELSRKQLPVTTDVIAVGVRQNVLILRGWDLYHLVSLRLGKSLSGNDLAEYLSAGGGWLEASAEGAVLHQGS